MFAVKRAWNRRPPPSLVPQFCGRPGALKLWVHTAAQDSSRNPTPPRLPSTFYHLYRLLFRSTTASVLAEPDATLTLRSLWRPVFTQAASVMRKFQSKRPSDRRRAAMTEWLQEWDKRGELHLLLENGMISDTDQAV